MSKGKLVIIEGGDGAGKSTLVRGLREVLVGVTKQKVLVSREPGGSPGAEEIRRLLLSDAGAVFDTYTQLLLHYAARADHLAKTILPALLAGELVILDRFELSSHVYQVAPSNNHQIDRTFKYLHDHVVEQLSPFRVVYIVLDVSEETATTRQSAQTGLNHLDRVDVVELSRRREAYRRGKEVLPEYPFIFIDANQSKEQVLSEVMEYVGL